MQIQVGYELIYECPQPTPMILANAPTYAPMDFAAWFEAYFGGSWHTLDSRINTPRIGRVLMARGRDAADVALATTFGPTTLKSFQVTAQELVNSVQT